MADPHPASQVSLKGVSAGYARTTVLTQLDLETPSLVVTAVMGPNGSGKSTLLGLLAGVIPATSGTVVHRTAVRPAFVTQRSAVADVLPLTVRETVAMGRWGRLGFFRRPSARDREAVETSMERLDVAGLAERQLGELSGGQRQRVLVAQGLAQGADLLLLDEPASALDGAARETIARVLDEVTGEGVTVVQATHDLAAARRAGHCLLLDAGRVVAAGPPADVLPDAGRVVAPRPPADVPEGAERERRARASGA
ncbi:ABC transporter ATP-binding protein [Streptomyces cinereoruber]|uniref:ABC transporter ATP-binding protein n=2 Tax=Streptomyces cinereoruber TaxID=67260 RepID=A0AAV4KKP7_9ACTN|nr:zinc ABC transporter ATP-binding protein AztA [Streptomyces cinereoruber]MBB4160716.1 zinc/manganese transport system ATP-binding protein [Streptomyces cinereoruber]NIH62765.1 zinc/manganese transport system ATP-binding protein [Streptomyces cinereoruber]GGR21958.1 ABC transporter ATP-binding protein [Streptomyces cinereoruber]